jgi:hypothetical protein
MKIELGRAQDFTCYTIPADFQQFILYAPVCPLHCQSGAMSFYFSLRILFFYIFTKYISSAAATVQNKHFFLLLFIFFKQESIKLEAEQRNVEHYRVIRFILSAECSLTLAI